MERSTSLNHNDNTLETDMALVVRRMRQRQQDHRRFYEHNDKINSRWSELVDQIYIHDEICKLRIYLDDRLNTEKSQLDLDAQLSNRYQHIFTCPDPVVLLMKKVVAKVVDIAQASSDSFKQPLQYYSMGFKRFKTTCLRASSDAISCRPANIIKIFSRFFHSKVMVEVERLRQIIKCLQQSDCKGLQALKDAYYCKLTLKELATPKKEVILSKELLQSDSTSIASIKIIKKEVKPMQSEKQIRIKVSKHEEKQKQKLRKLQIKRLKRYVQSICEVMDVNREQLLEDMFIDFKQSESRRILTQLTGRNKHNFTQIEMFVDNTKDAIIDTSLLEVHTVSNLKEKLVEASSSERVIAESTPQVIKVSPSKNQRDANLRYLRRDSLNIKPRNMYKQRKTVNNMNEVPITEVSEPERKGDFAQLIIKDQSSKQRFPQIYARATSVDNEKAQKKDIHLKILKNQKINKEQLQLGRAGQSSNQTFTSKKHNAEHIETNSKQIRREKIESKIKLQLKTGTNFFEEIGKRISKFCEMKKNLKV